MSPWSGNMAADGTAYNFAYTFATIVGGRAVAPKGVDVTDDLRKYDDALPWERRSGRQGGVGA